MKLKKIKYLFLLSSSITIIPAIAMSCDKNEEPGNNTGTTDKQVTPPIKFYTR
ncbi:variable surface lipoprotein [Mycoplasmopsis felis]|uniref:variable surface lipoprotein n=1 Tax=Mycoplasmopsis felis TaxID=33923 RepID=UPI0021AE6CE6|nr:variable surface lipoprotein [Mycoplasmopsis felis]UWV84431.1 variable surface lipoprotein [Mycoplasmopsis felis]UWW01031.1 variable surface lipoprotein [Mycoplasmopsis felis]